MSVRIVDPNPDPSVVKFVLCRQCGVKLSYVPNDVGRYTTRDYTGDQSTHYYIKCAGCEDKVIVRGY